MNEGNPKWYRSPQPGPDLNARSATRPAGTRSTQNCDLLPVLAYLSDHKADTLDRVVKRWSEFAEKHTRRIAQFLLAAGNAGIEAATNIVVRESQPDHAALRVCWR
jgi:hypothetical protein